MPPHPATPATRAEPPPKRPSPLRRLRRAARAAAVVASFARREAARAAEAETAPEAATEPAPSSPPPFRTTVTAPETPPSVAREDRAAAASVVLPADSPRAYDDLGSLLLQVPGVTVTRTGSSQAFSTVTLRGSNPDQVSIYVDGVPLDIAEGGGVDISTLPLGDVERVEVYRGTTPLAFGESALGGVVSVTTRAPGVPRATARAGVGSFRTAFGDVSGGGHLGPVRVYAGAHVYSSQGDYPLQYNNAVTNPDTGVDTVRANNDTLEGNGVFRAMLPLQGRRTLGLALIGFARAEGLPGPTGNLALHARFHTDRTLGILRYESRDDLGAGSRLTAAAFASVARNRLLDPDAEVQKQPGLVFQETTLSLGTTVHATRPLMQWGRLAGLLEARRETYTPENETDEGAAGLPARRLIGVAGAELTLFVRSLDLEVTPSARVEGMRDTVTGVDTNDRPVPAGPPVTRWLPTYRLGLVRPLSAAVVLKANVGRYQHAPSFLQLYGDGTRRLLGNPDLVPESGTNADLAAWIDRRGARVALASRTTLFGALTDDLIYWLPNAGGPSRAENLSRARIYGLEQELQLGVGRHARLVAQGTYLVAQDESDIPANHGKQLPHHPRLSAYLRPEIVRIGLRHGVELGGYVDAALLAGDYDDPAHLKAIPAQALVGAGLSVSRPLSRLRLAVSAYNLTGAQAWNFSYWPLPGRTIFASLAYDSALPSDADPIEDFKE